MITGFVRSEYLALLNFSAALMVTARSCTEKSLADRNDLACAGFGLMILSWRTMASTDEIGVFRSRSATFMFWIGIGMASLRGRSSDEAFEVLVSGDLRFPELMWVTDNLWNLAVEVYAFL